MMSTVFDSFDGSRNDGFVHSDIDERNLQPPEIYAPGHLVLMVQQYTGQLGVQRTWEDIYADRNTPVAYFTGEVSTQLPYYQAQGEVGPVVWQYDRSVWNGMRARFTEISGGYDLRLGIMHHRTWIPTMGAQFTMPLAPGDDLAWLQGYEQLDGRADVDVDPQGVLNRYIALTHSCAAEPDPIIALWGYSNDTRDSGGYLLWLPWAQEHYTNLPDTNLGFHTTPYPGRIAWHPWGYFGFEPNYVHDPRWLWVAAMILKTGIPGGGWPDFSYDGYIPNQ